MSEVSYSNVPPMMAAIKSGDIEAIRSLLHAGHSPNEPQCYQVMIGDWPRDDEAFPLELAVLENRMDMVQLLIECGADLTHNPEELLCGSLRSQDLTLFSFLVDVGVRIPATQRDICRLFLHLVDRDEPNVLSILKRMGMDLKQYGGEALRSMASHGNQLLLEYLIQNGADINYHKPDMVFPYASTPVTEAARHNDFSMVRWLVEQGADITIPDKYGDRPYTVAVQNKNQEMAAYLKALEPEEWHNEQEKARQLMPYKLPAKLVEYLKTGPLRLEFPERELVKWAELYPYMDVQEMTWKRKKLLSLMAKMDNYSDYLLLWSPRDKKLWYLDIEHTPTKGGLTMYENDGGLLSPRDAYRLMLKDYPDVMDIGQMCEALGVSTKTGYKLLKDGKIEYLKIGRAYRIPKAHILRYLKITCSTLAE